MEALCSRRAEAAAVRIGTGKAGLWRDVDDSWLGLLAPGTIELVVLRPDRCARLAEPVAMLRLPR
jgi:hypothetical protein